MSKDITGDFIVNNRQKKFEYINRTFYAKGLNLIDTLNGYGQYGYQIVSCQTFMYALEPTKIWKYEVIFMKEIIN